MISISKGLQYVVESMVFDYVDYKVDIYTPSVTTVAYGRCYKSPGKTYGVIDVTEIIQAYCNFKEVFENENYLNANSMSLTYPNLKFRIGIKNQNQSVYTDLVSLEEVLASYHNTVYDLIPTNGTVPDVLQHQRQYYANFNGRVPYDIVRKHYDGYYGIRTYWRPDGKDALLFSNSITKAKVNHFMYPLLATVENYVEIWTVSYTSLGVETEIPNSRVRYTYTKPFCSNNEYIVYWVNRYGGLEQREVDGRTFKTISSTPYNFNTYDRNIIAGANITKNNISFKKGTQQVTSTNEYKCNFHQGMTLDSEWDYMETLYSSPMIWLYDIANLVYIPVTLKDNQYSFDYLKNNRKQLPKLELTFETSGINIRR